MSNVKKSTEDAAQAVETSCRNLTLDKANEAPKQECEPQTKLSNREIKNSPEIYLKPKKTVSCRDKFNEKFRKDWEFDSQPVRFIAENKEIIGETINIWTRPYGGIPAQEWEVPTNKPVWGPRYLAEQIKRACYHRLKMEDKVISNDGYGQMYGQMVAEHTIQRLDAYPADEKRSIFMGSGTNG